MHFQGSVRQICKGHIDGSACSLAMLGCVGLWMVDSRVENGDGVEMARSLYSTWHVSRCIGCHTETDGSLPGLGLLKRCNPCSTHDCFPRRSSLAFLDDARYCRLLAD